MNLVKEHSKFVAILIIALAFWSTSVSSTIRRRSKPRPVVDITNGKIRGVNSYSRNKTPYFEFLGIPYAKPPIGDLRFESPQPAEHWDETLDADHYKSECIQLDVVVTGRVLGQEDCLYLNVFSPQLKPRKLMPVMVFVHGGLFMAGSADKYRAKYFMDQPVVLVTMNYRLGAFGFLTTGEGLIRGNMGLRDQILALRWVQENIKKFGGDNSKVTIFGESAGAASVQFLMLSPLTKGLIHKGISQSGTATRKYLLTDKQNLQAKHFASQLQCSIENSTGMVDCLRRADAGALVRVHKEALRPERNKFSIFGPVVEYLKDSEAVIVDEPINTLQSGNFIKRPWMVGVNNGEGLLYVAQILRDQTLLEKLEEDWGVLFPKLLRLDANSASVSERVRQYYFGNSEKLDIKQTIQKFTDMFSDRYFNHPTKVAAEYYARYAPTYLYYFSYKTPITIFDLVMAITPSGFQPPELEFASYFAKRWFRQNLLRAPSKFYGASHGDELSMVFNTHRLAEIKRKSKHYPLSRAMVKLWADFADDDSLMTFQGIPFNSVNTDKNVPVYLEINNPGRLIYEPFTERVRFWESLNIVDTL